MPEKQTIKRISIAIFSSTRADFGLLKSLIIEMKKDKFFDVKFVITGSHISEKFGNTEKEVLRYIDPDERIEILQSSDTDVGNATSTALGLIRFSDYLNKLQPKLIILLGDRFEIFSVGIAATFLRIPIAHLHGGELTQGAFDDGFRHSLTKLSHLHFVSNDKYKKRVIQLGENPKSVFNVGGLGAEAIKKIKLYSKKTIEDQLNVKLLDKNILVTYHPVTLDKEVKKNEFFEIIKAIRKFPNINFIFTMPNHDVGHNNVLRLIKNECFQNENRYFVKSMGQGLYFSCLKYVDGVLGNSSSGILEVPSFKKGTINIGTRQKGRIMPESVINCNPVASEITTAIKDLYTLKFRKKLKIVKNPYYKINTTKNIISAIKKNYKNISLKKEFFDI